MIKTTFEKWRPWITPSLLLIAISVLHYMQLSMEWEVHEFYRRLYYIPVLLSAFRGGLRAGIISSVAAALLYSPHVLLIQPGDSLILLNQFMEMVMFFFIGTMTGFFTERLQRNQLILAEQVEQLSDQETRTRSIIESVPHLMLATNRRLEIVQSNRVARDIFDMMNVPMGNLAQLVPRHAYAGGPFEEVINGKVPHWGENVELVFPSGIRTFVSTASPLFRADGAIEGLVVTMRDITDVLQMEKQLQRAERLSALGVMASGIAHEIRNPLGIIRAIAQQLDVKQTEEAVEGQQIILEEIDRASSVIQDILDFARPSLEQKELLNTGELLEHMKRLTEKFAAQHEMRIELERTENTLIFADRKKIIQALVNIVINGIQSMKDGGVVRIDTEVIGRDVCISVHDQGAGMTNQQMAQLFDPFFSTKEKGTGLGLAIAYRIIEQHNGRIDVSSQIGNGSTFTICVPLKEASNENHLGS